MKFVTVISCRFSDLPVLRHPVPHRILHNQHAQLFKLVAQVPDVKTHDPVLTVYIRPVVEVIL